MSREGTVSTIHIESCGTTVVKGHRTYFNKFVSQHLSDAGSSPVGSMLGFEFAKTPLLILNHKRCCSINCPLIL